MLAALTFGHRRCTKACMRSLTAEVVGCYLGTDRLCGSTSTGLGPGFFPGPGQAGVFGVDRLCGLTGTVLGAMSSSSNANVGSHASHNGGPKGNHGGVR